MSAQPTPPQIEASKASPGSADGVRTAVTALALFVFALAIRALPWPSVLTPDRVLFVGTDAYYHARRILYSLVHFPDSLAFDRYINFPDGARPIWSALFDSLIAFSLRPFLDGSDGVALDRALVWVPPLLGALTVVATYLLARRAFDQSVAVIAGAVLCVLSGHFWYSQIGFLDHHAAVSLFGVILIALSMKQVDSLSDESSTPLSTALAAGMSGVAWGACLLLWPGMLLHLALALVGVLIFLINLGSSAQAARAADSFAAAAAIALGMVWLFSGSSDWPQFSAYSPVVLSRFQPWLFAVLAIGMTVLGVVWRSGQGSSGLARGLHTLAVGVLLLALSGLFIPDLAAAVEDAWRWLGKQEHFQSTVAESRGLFDVHGQFGVRIAEARLSRFLYLSPFALIAFAFHAGRSPNAHTLRVIIPWALGLGIVTIYQKRFFNSFSIPLALLIGWSIVHGWRSLRVYAQSALQRQALALGMIAFVAWGLAPMYAAYEVPLRDLQKLLRGEEPQRKLAGPDFRALIRTADWMRANTPTTQGFADAAVPEYGVIALWGNGHIIEYVGHRPTVTNSFGDDIGEANFRKTLRYFASTDEAECSAILDELGARYVLAESLTGGKKPRRANRKMMSRLYDGDGNGLSRHRLLYETISEAKGSSHPQRFKVFEHVAGAVVRGSAIPGARVRASLNFTTNRGRRGVYHIHTDAGEDGQYQLRLPHSTHGGPPAILTEDEYLLQMEGGASAKLSIDEAAVQEGRQVSGPSLAGAPRNGAEASGE